MPVGALLPLVSLDAAHVIWGYGAASETFDRYAPSLALFGPGLILFTVHYLMLRGYYALELTRTVFFIPCAVAVVNIAAALALVTHVGPEGTSPALVVAYGASYATGAAISYTSLARRLGGPGVLQGRRTLRFLVRLGCVVAGSTGAAALVALGFGAWDGADSSWIAALARAGVVTAVDVVAFVTLARVFRITEVTSMISQVSSRLSSGRRG
ncbi:hypothetical protein BH09ACT12_BH09ACT12_33500 [soil metagenome]